MAANQKNGPTIREVLESRQRYIEAAKYLDDPVVQYTSHNRAEHTNRSRGYRDLLRCLQSGLEEVVDGVTYESVRVDSPVFGSCVEIREVTNGS